MIIIVGKCGVETVLTAQLVINPARVCVIRVRNRIWTDDQVGLSPGGSRVGRRKIFHYVKGNLV